MGYIIVDRTAHRDAYQQISERTTGLDNICVTMIPYKIAGDATITAPLVFERKADAAPYLDRIRQLVRVEEDKAGHLNALFNRRKPVYKLEKYNV